MQDCCSLGQPVSFTFGILTDSHLGIFFLLDLQGYILIHIVNNNCYIRNKTAQYTIIEWVWILQYEPEALKMVKACLDWPWELMLFWEATCWPPFTHPCMNWEQGCTTIFKLQEQCAHCTLIFYSAVMNNFNCWSEALPTPIIALWNSWYCL